MFLFDKFPFLLSSEWVATSYSIFTIGSNGKSQLNYNVIKNNVLDEIEKPLLGCPGFLIKGMDGQDRRVGQ